jgi:two-component system, cell cycle sensor histidine kinase and response regulator CckA
MGARDAAAISWQGLAVLDLMQEGLQVFDFDLRYLYANRAAAAQGRYTPAQLSGRLLLDCYPTLEHTPLLAAMKRCLRERAAECLVNVYTFPEGKQASFEVRIEPVPEGVMLVSIDITHRRELEAGLALTQKMDALGRLAGGVAHDFNNILTVIVHATEFVTHALPDEDPSQADLREILSVADRGARMVRQLLAFSRQQPRDAKPLSLNDTLAELLPILRRLVPECVAIELALDPECPSIRIDQNQLTQVMLNLVANARDAIGSRGTVWISCATVDPGDARKLFRVADDYGDFVRICVTDDGSGMDQATVARMFEPFFNTKQDGQGTGLGLAATHGIVKQNDGEIRVLSTPEQGTSVELYFPRFVSETDPRRPAPPLPQLRGGSEVILVVDDEPSIRALCARSLSKLGYTVMQVDGATEALRFASRYSGHIDLVLSDVAMPEMNGVVLCRQLCAARPKLRTLLMSGYVSSSNHPELDPQQVLAKPFTQADLALRVREVLEAEASAAFE